MRTCLVCRQPRNQADCCRLVVHAESLFYDVDRRAPGRGWYVCRKPECLRRFLRGRRVGRLPLTAAALEPDSRARLEVLAAAPVVGTQEKSRKMYNAKSDWGSQP